MTLEEKKLWYDYLRTYPIRILRQKVISNYVVDFYCRKANIAIEIDGSQHFSDEGINKDMARTEIIESFGIKVIRFSNSDVINNFEGVCNKIDIEIKNRI